MAVAINSWVISVSMDWMLRNKEFMSTCIKKLEDTGAKPTFVTFNGILSNFNMSENLGCKLEEKENPYTPFAVHSLV